MERRGGGSRAQFSLNPQSINTRTFNATLVLNSGSGTKQEIVGPHPTVLVPLSTYPILFSLPLPSQHPWASGRVLSGYCWESVALVGMAVGVLGTQAPETYLSSPQSLFFPQSYCPCSS